MGPLLFLLYMNDLAFCVPEFNTILFADDTSLSLAGQNYIQLLQEFNRLLGRVSDWLRVNLLSLNVSKTKYMLFKKQRENMDHGKVFINGEEVLRVGKGLKQETYKYLGVLIGEDLTFSEHVTRIKGKLMSASFILNQSKNFLPFKARLQVYRSLFESHLNFATIVWSVNRDAVTKLGSIQQKALRYIFLKPRQSHVTPLLSPHNILKVDQLITSVRAKFIHNLRIRRLPDQFDDFVKMMIVSVILDFHSSTTAWIKKKQTQNTTSASLGTAFHTNSNLNNLMTFWRSSEDISTIAMTRNVRVKTVGSVVIE